MIRHQEYHLHHPGRKQSPHQDIASRWVMAAATEGNYEAAALLLSHGADVNGPSITISPLVAAIHAKSLSIVEFLFDRGADPNKSPIGMRPVRFVLGEMACWHDVRKPPR
ncbi:hypothetical protein B0T18DRAFT_420095, partial [Schizothecium vesticola]